MNRPVDWILGTLNIVATSILRAAEVVMLGWAAYLLIGALAVLLTACPGHFDAAWRTTAAVREAGTLTDQAIATAMRHKLEMCKAHPETLQTCLQSSREWAAVQGWRQWGIPAVNSAIASTVAALQIAERTKATSIDWIHTLKPAACALSRVLAQWGSILPASAQTTVKAATGALGSLACEVSP